MKTLCEGATRPGSDGEERRVEKGKEAGEGSTELGAGSKHGTLARLHPSTNHACTDQSQPASPLAQQPGRLNTRPQVAEGHQQAEAEKIDLMFPQCLQGN